MRRSPRTQKILFIAALISVAIYLGWRFLFTLPFSGSLFALIFGIALLLSEFVSSFTGFVLIWTKQKYQEVPLPDVENWDYPHIDVLIATHNEPKEILYKTVNACVNMDYPDRSKVHIYLCDDTNRSEIAQLAKDFNIGYFGLANNKHAKSGNLNNAVKQTTSPVIATFDADMIPYSSFLMDTVPYFYDAETQTFNDKRGFVQTPQSFYNADVFHYNLFTERSIPNEQDFFSREVNVLNTSHNAAVYTGSNTLISRQAIVDSGYFPTNTITEDFQLGVEINSRGYESIATTKVLASGLSPTDIRSVIKQRTRWARGVIQSIYNTYILINHHISLAQRIVYLSSFMYWWSFARRLLYIMAPILFTVFDIQVVETDFWILLLMWAPSYFLQRMALSYVSSAIRTQRWGEIYETILAPYLFFPVLFETLGIKQKKFKVTNKERSTSRLDWALVVPHLILFVLALIGLIRFNYGKYGFALLYGSVINFWLIHHITNLFFAVCFTLGRPSYRKYERFLVSRPLSIKMSQQTVNTETIDVSENGLSFALNRPYYFSEEAAVPLEITSKRGQIVLTASVVRVKSTATAWTYMMKLVSIDEANLRRYLLFIYDQHNDNLPTTRDPWMSVLDEFWNNITKRRVQVQTTPILFSKRPVLRLNHSLMIEGHRCLVRSFDYHTMGFENDSWFKAKKRLDVNLSGYDVQLEYSHHDAEMNLLVYEVLNYQDFCDDSAVSDLMMEWSQAK